MVISIGLLLALLMTHWLGDFVLQSDWMAKNKSTNFFALLAHGLTYSTLFAWVAFLYGPHGGLWLVVNFWAHLITDYFTSRLNTRLWAAGQVHNFFVSVGFDQLLHFTTLILTAWWLV